MLSQNKHSQKKKKIKKPQFRYCSRISGSAFAQAKKIHVVRAQRVALGTLDPADSSVSTHPNPIPPRTARGGTSLHFISKPRVPIPLQVQARPIPAPHHGRLLSVPFSADDPFSISFQSFRPRFCTSMFISLCMYVLNDVATLYKVSPVPLE